MDPRVTRTRTAVVSAAADLLLESGAAAVTVDAIIKRSGVARSTIYRHFTGTTDILRAAVDALLPGSELPVDGTVESAADIRETVERYLISLAARLRDSSWARVLPGLLELVARDPSLELHRQDLVRHHREPLQKLLSQAVSRGLLTADTDLDEMAAALVGPLFYRRFITGEDISDELCRRVVRTVFPLS